MLKLAQRGRQKIWHIEGRYRGQRVRESTFTRDRTLAEAKRAKIEAELSHKAIFGPKRTCTFGAAAYYYMRQGGERTFMNKLLDAFGATLIDDLTSDAVATAAAKLYPNCSPASIVRFVYTPLHAAINKAAKADMCEARRFEKPKVPRRAATEYATDDYLLKLLNQGCTTPHQCAILLLMSYTGARDAEAINLAWPDVDFVTCYVTLRMTKNGDPRRVAMALPLREALLKLRTPDADGFVFNYSSRHSLIQMTRRACKRAGLKYLSPHKIGRHAFAARLLADGFSIKFVAEAGGWKTYRVVAETYGHIEQSAVDAVLHKSGDKLSAALNNPGTVVPLKRRTGTGDLS